MRIVHFSTRKPVTVTMGAAAVIIFGIISFNNLAINLLPEITFPTLTIRSAYPGSAPGEIENLLSKPIEEAVGIVNGVIRVSSASRSGLSDVVLEFDWGTNMDFAAIDIREKLDGVNLPQDAEKPILLRFDPSLDPIMRISLSGTKDLATLRLLAEEQVKRRLESIEGVASVTISGGFEEEIHVDLVEARLSSLDISIDDVTNRLSKENINLTGGTLKDAEAEFLVRTLNQFVTVSEINEIVIAERGSAVIRLKDVGRAYRSTKERTTITRTNGIESIEIAVFKEADTNTVTVATSVRERLDEIVPEIGSTFPSVKIDVVSDQSGFIRQSIRDVLKTAIWGGILAVIILYFFLKNLRSTAIISLAIPMSVIAAFFLMYLAKISLNIMSLGGLALGVGMLVDNSIVVLESISRYRSQKKSLIEAANLGASEVGRAVTAATLTTICVFVPIIFVQGVAGQLFMDQALTVTFSLLASLLAALTIIPMLSSVSILRDRDDPAEAKPGAPAATAPESSTAIALAAWPLRLAKKSVQGTIRLLRLLLSPLYALFDRLFGIIAQYYPMILARTLRHRTAVLLIAFLFFLASLLLIPLLGSELIPEVSQGEFIIDVKTPAGTPLEVTNQAIKNLEEIAAARQDVIMIYSLVGAAGGFSTSQSEERENTGQINIALAPETKRGGERNVMDELRSQYADIPGLETKFSLPALFSFKAPIEIEIKGYNLDRLAEIAGLVSRKLEAIPGIRDIRSNLDDGNLEVQIAFNRNRIAAMGLDIETIATTIREKIQGEVATEYSSGDRKIDIRVRIREEDRKSLSDLNNLTITTREKAFVPLSSIADLTKQQGPGEILRMDQERAALVTANLNERDLGGAVREIEAAIQELELSSDYTIAIGGQRNEMAVSFRSMRLAILLAVFLVYMVMAAQFESLLHPLVIMFTIPFGLVGIILILFITGVPISVVVLIGAIMMTGIVVNNAIVLVDYINRLRRDGRPKREAIMEACRIRLRPILMTTATTVLGLLPMALGLGDGAEIRSPMAISIIGGISLSTVLTLILIPAAYAVIDRRQDPA